MLSHLSGLIKVLDVEHTEDPNRNLTVVIVKKGDKLAGLIVDNLMGQLEIVIRVNRKVHK